MFGKKGQARMPSSFGGLVQYYSEYKSKIVLKPYVVIILGVILVAVVLTASALF
ncbi:MAG: preprotein translocase subunit Sec61beta [Candidatus Parvarchaeota archaeon]|nr:preprotein translocase subunit Sec61beta [Candidatus Parvarchaeota archaeon]